MGILKIGEKKMAGRSKNDKKIERLAFTSDQNLKEKDYWLKKLSGDLNKSIFPYDVKIKDVNADETRLKVFTSRVSDQLFSRLTQISSNNDGKLHVILVTGAASLLKIYSGNNDIIVGIPIYKQDIQGDFINGDFINTVLAIRNRLENHLTFKQIIMQVHKSIFDAVENQNYPIETLLYHLNMTVSHNDFPLFDTAVLLKNIHDKTYLKDIPLNMIFSFSRTGNSLEMTVKYNSLLYRETTIGRITKHFKRLLQQGVFNVDMPLNRIEILSREEKKQLIYDFNDTKAGYPADMTIHELFARQVIKTPDHIALAGDRQLEEPHQSAPAAISITYRQLNDKSNQLARVLKKKGVSPDTIVGIMLEPSPGMIEGILGTLKAGGIYLPLDPTYPEERVKYMLEDSRTPILLTNTRDIKNRSYTALQGRGQAGLQTYLTGTRSPITDFDGLSFPDRSLVNYEKYNRYIGQAMVKNSISLQGTRGCPYNCSYCHKIWPKKHSVRSAENLLEEVELYYNMGIRRFVIIDDIFNLDIKNSARFFKLITKKGLDLRIFFPNGLRGDLLTREYIDLMVEAGTVGLALALETAAPRLQKLIGKHLRLDKLRENITYFCQQYPQVILELFTMHGFPTETEEEAMLTLNFIKNLEWLHFPYVHILKIYPNTDMARLALENGIPAEAIANSANLAYHELPETLPFDKAFTLKYQADFLNEYFLLKERLLHVLPYQLKVLTQDEIVQKYDSYLPADIETFNHLLEFAGIAEKELAVHEFLDEDMFFVPHLNSKIKKHFPGQEEESASHKPDDNPLKVLLLDLSQYFSQETRMLYDVVEPPLGLMYVMTHLKRQYKGKVKGKIAKSRIDFDNYTQLKHLLADFKPDIIGIRTLTFYRDFFHQTAAMIRHWGYKVPVIAGGPYATSDYAAILQDRYVDLVVMGEGENTFTQLIGEIIANNGQLPGETVLKEIPGIAYVPKKAVQLQSFKGCREILFPDVLDVDENHPVTGDSGKNLENSNKSADSAYIIYTSGTTGKPKGTLIQHGNVVRLMVNDKNLFDFNSHDVWTLFHSYCFDFSVWEMYGALLFGGKLMIIPRMTARDPGMFLELLKRERVTILNQTPSAFYGLRDEALKFPGQELYLRYIIFGGEALQPVKLKKWQEKYPETRLINMYGITETTVHVTFKEISHKDVAANLSNIGKPIPTLTTFIMDKHLQLLPIGVAGEICVGGAGVARGYLNQQELTREKFTVNPYIPGEKFYKSGDLGRILDNGEIEYLGRIDQQIKIRGFRIEPGEIESRLLTYHKIKDAVVMAKDNESGDKYLNAYIVANEELDGPDIKAYLLKHLPDYAIPAYFIQLDHIPLTTNKKVDSKALEKLEGSMEMTGNYIPPRNDTEKKLAKIWSNCLALEKVGIKDSYFNIGGDSIKAITLLSQVNRELDTHLKIPDIYLNETLEKLAALIDQQKVKHFQDEVKEILIEIAALKDRIIAQLKLGNNIADIYPMSDIEKGMIFYTLKNPGSGQYHDQFVYRLKYRQFDKELFKKAAALLVEKHSILRTCFNMQDFEEPIHIVYKDSLIDWEDFDISHMETKNQEEYIKNFLGEDRKKTFHINTPPLWRLRLFLLGRDYIAILWSFHHAILDGWSNASFMTELNNTYWQLKSHHNYQPEQLKCDYKQFVVEQILEKKKSKTIDYWKSELAGYKRLEFLNKGEQRTSPGKIKKYRYPLSQELAKNLTDTAVKYRTSLKHLCWGAYMFILYMLSYENDIVAGLVTNNRPVCEDGEKILGCFLNTIPVRIIIPPHIKWREYIKIVENKMMEIKKFDRLSLVEIARTIGEETREDRNPLFDTFLNFIDFHVYNRVESLETDNKPENEGLTGLLMESYENVNTRFNFSVDTTFGNFVIRVLYSTELIDEESVKKSCHYFERVLNKFVDSPWDPVEKTAILSREEKNQILTDFNNTLGEYPRNRTIHELFEEQVNRSPDDIAVADLGTGEQGEGPQGPGTRFFTPTISGPDTDFITYGELNNKANQLAGCLNVKGVYPDTIVGIMMKRSTGLIVAILGILKAGGAYLPIDPDFPQQRITYMFNDSGTGILLTHRGINNKIKESSFNGYIIDLSDKSAYEVKRKQWQPPTTPGNLAYVIYTSGSTGKPKAVTVKHQNVVRLVKDSNFIDFSSGDRLLMTGSPVFDITTFEIWGPLLNKIRLYLAEENVILEVEKLSKIITRNNISILHLIPGLLNQIAVQDTRVFSGLNYFLVGGDMVQPQYIKQIRNRTRELKILHMYGPTENTTFSTYFTVKQDYALKIPIGKPVRNSTVYIIDKFAHLQPIGVVGELCTGGDGVARGYLNRPELTKEKFVPNPFIPGEIIYKTGDLAKWLADGNIEFAGRIDQQVKIKGIRIEPGEIEMHLIAIKGIKEAVVIDKEDDGAGDRYLCAYFTSEKGVKISELRRILSRSLPEAFIPQYIVQLEKIPLTTNGKIHRKMLPEPEVRIEGEYKAPTNEIEKKLLNIWTAVLGIQQEKISIDANFFELGGHSLRAMTLIAQIHKIFKIKIPLAEIFRLPDIKRLAQYIMEAKKHSYASIEPAEKKDYYPPSPAQKRLYFLQQIDRESTGYNMPIAMVTGIDIDHDRFENTFRKLIARHENLRTSFETVEEKTRQRIHQHVPFAVDYFTARGEIEIEAIINQFVRAFDLFQAPLLRIGMIEPGDGQHIVMIDMHHIISDGVSHEILLRDFRALYAGKQLPKLKLQYKDYSQWMQSELQGTVFRQQEKFWLNEFEGEIPVLNLPLDYPRPEIKSFAGDSIRFELSKEESAALNEIALEQGTTMFMVLLATTNILLAKLSGQEDIVIGTPVAGRRHADLEQIIGIFINTLALRNFPEGGKTFNSFLNELKEKTLKAFENQEYQFEDLVKKLTVPRDTARNPLFDILFALQNCINVNEEPENITDEQTHFKWTDYGYRNKISKFDLSLDVLWLQEKLIFAVEYNTDLFKPETIKRFMTYYREIVSAVIENKEITLNKINISHDLVDVESYIHEDEDSDFVF